MPFPCLFLSGVWEWFHRGRGKLETSVCTVSSGSLQWFGVTKPMMKLRCHYNSLQLLSMKFVPYSRVGYHTLKGLARENYVGLFSWLLWSFPRIVHRLLWKGCEEVCQVVLEATCESYIFHLRSILLWSWSYLVPQLQKFSLVQITSWGKFWHLTTVFSFLVISFFNGFYLYFRQSELTISEKKVLAEQLKTSQLIPVFEFKTPGRDSSWKKGLEDWQELMIM